MIRITALNEVESSEPVKEVCQEKLEQIAFQQYEKALDLQSRGNSKQATRFYKDLLNMEVLSGVEKPEGNKTSQLWYLRYLCYKNLASIFGSEGKLDEAIEAYSAASELDDTDVSLWHRFGQVCMQAKHFEMALYAFQRGVECNPRHWPSVDQLLTLLLAFDCIEHCLVVIHQALQLDPGYLRGLVYRKHIYTVYKHMREYMEYSNPIYKWNEEDNMPIDEEKAKGLIKEAEDIYNAYVEQQEAENVLHMMPCVSLKKPLSSLTWESVGASLNHMHHYMTENCLSHACLIELSCQNDLLEESDTFKPKRPRMSLRYRSTASISQQTVKAGTTHTGGNKHTIYKTLRDLSKQFPSNFDVHKLIALVMPPDTDNEEYFGTECEQKDVKEFIKKYTENKKDIIDLLNDYLSILACKSNMKWPTGLAKIFIEANSCYSTHIDIPAFVNDCNEEILHYVRVNLLAEELVVDGKVKAESTEPLSHNLSMLDSIEIILTVNPYAFPSEEYLDLLQWLLSLKCIVHILNGRKDLALESLFQLYYEFGDA